MGLWAVLCEIGVSILQGQWQAAKCSDLGFAMSSSVWRESWRRITM